MKVLGTWLHKTFNMYGSAYGCVYIRQPSAPPVALIAVCRLSASNKLKLVLKRSPKKKVEGK
jgi:hypothetical protein